VRRPGAAAAPTGADRTSVFRLHRDDHPGALLALLTESRAGVNLSRIESRPTGGRLGQYFFSLDCDGHLADERVGEALSALHRVCADVRVLGSWARADGVRTGVARGTSDEEFRDAAAWLARLRAGG
jgi:prephenate dehydratase